MTTKLIVVITAHLLLVPLGSTLGAQTQVRPWSAVGSTCAPDNDAPYTRYEVARSSGYIEHSTNITGGLYFTCNVTTPVDSYPGEPDWNRLYLTFKDPDANGLVEARLYRKNLSNGTATAMATVTSTNGTGVRSTYVDVSGFDFDTYAYFVRVRIYRSVASSDQEFHVVSLEYIFH